MKDQAQARGMASAYLNASSHPWPSTPMPGTSDNGGVPAAAGASDAHPSLPPVSPMSPLLPDEPTMLMAPVTPPRNVLRSASKASSPQSTSSPIQSSPAKGSYATTTTTSPTGPLQTLATSSLPLNNSPSPSSTLALRLQNDRSTKRPHRRPSRLSFRSDAFRHPSQASSHTGFAVNPTPPASAPPLITSIPDPASPASNSTKLASRTKNLLRKLSMPLRKLGKKHPSKEPATPPDLGHPSRDAGDSLIHAPSTATSGHLQPRSQTLDQLCANATQQEEAQADSRSTSSVSLSPAMLSTVPHPNPQLRSTQSAGQLLVSQASISASASQAPSPSPTRSQYMPVERAAGPVEDQEQRASGLVEDQKQRAADRLSTTIGESFDAGSNAAEAGSIDSARASSQLRLSASPPPGMVVGLEDAGHGMTHGQEFSHRLVAAPSKQTLRSVYETQQQPTPLASPRKQQVILPTHEKPAGGDAPSPRKHAVAASGIHLQRDLSPKQVFSHPNLPISPATSPKAMTSSPTRHQSTARALESHGATSGHPGLPPPSPAPSAPLPPIPNKTAQNTLPIPSSHVARPRQTDDAQQADARTAGPPCAPTTERQPLSYSGQSRLSRDWSARSNLTHNDGASRGASPTPTSSCSSDLSTSGPFVFDELSLIPASRPSSGIEPPTGALQGSPFLSSLDHNDTVTTEALRTRHPAGGHKQGQGQTHDSPDLYSAPVAPIPAKHLFSTITAMSSSTSAPHLTVIAHGPQDPTPPPPTFTTAQVRAFERLLPDPPARGGNFSPAAASYMGAASELHNGGLAENAREENVYAQGGAPSLHAIGSAWDKFEKPPKRTESELTLSNGNVIAHKANDDHGTASAADLAKKVFASAQASSNAGSSIFPLLQATHSMTRIQTEDRVQIPGSYPPRTHGSADARAPDQHEQSTSRDVGTAQPAAGSLASTGMPRYSSSASIDRQGREQLTSGGSGGSAPRGSGGSSPPHLPPRTSSRLALADLEIVRDLESTRDAFSGPQTVRGQDEGIDGSISASSSAATLVGSGHVSEPLGSTRGHFQTSTNVSPAKPRFFPDVQAASSREPTDGHADNEHTGLGIQIDVESMKDGAGRQHVDAGTAPAVRDALRTTTLL